MTDIAKEYGTALFMIAKEEEAVAAFAGALSLVQDAFAQNGEYQELLASPGIPLKERTALLEQAFASSVPESVLSFLSLLCEQGHIREFAACKAEYDALYNEAARVSRTVIKSAVPLSDGEKQTLIDKLQTLSGHTVEAVYEIDESLLGGVVVEMDDRVIDGSLKRQMRKLKEVISQ